MYLGSGSSKSLDSHVLSPGFRLRRSGRSQLLLRSECLGHQFPNLDWCQSLLLLASPVEGKQAHPRPRPVVHSARLRQDVRRQPRVRPVVGHSALSAAAFSATHHEREPSAKGLCWHPTPLSFSVLPRSHPPP